MSELNTNIVFTIALEIVTILQSKPIDKDGEQDVLQMVNSLLKFRDTQKDSETSSSNNIDK